jgi:flagellar hook assembly protein FlgD
LTEDVSPVIKFSVEYADEIDITIYSIQAIAVTTIFKGNLMPGNYKYVWNGRDDKGKKMKPGDYIAEVKMGKYKFYRKRIVVP